MPPSLHLGPFCQAFTSAVISSDRHGRLSVPPLGCQHQDDFETSKSGHLSRGSGRGSAVQKSSVYGTWAFLSLSLCQASSAVDAKLVRYLDCWRDPTLQDPPIR